MPKRPPAPPPRDPAPAHPPVARRELLALAAILLLAAGFRFAFPARMAVEHFDEGVYASNIFFSPEEGNRYPYRHLYAPPLLPWLIEWAIVFLGPESIAPFLPALILGTATVPLAWWSARCWFGPAAGLAAALLLAASDFHVLYSRTALTDAPVAFFLLLAVYLYWEAVRRRSLAWSAAAGLATALAWWTKYTGWLPLAIAASGTAAWLLTQRRAGGVSPPSSPERLKPALACLAVTAATALAAWSPVLYGLQPYGGYAEVAKNHRGYLEPHAWLTNLWEQTGNVAAQSGAITVVAVALLAALIPAQAAWPLAARALLAFWSALTAGWATSIAGPVPPLALIAATTLFVELVPRRFLSAAPTAEAPDPSRALAAWLLAAWLAGMTLTTPLYHPYPRLAMPWLLAALLAAGMSLSRGRRTFEFGAWPVDRAAIAAPLLLALPAALFVAARHPAPWFTAGWTFPGWQDRTTLRTTAARLARHLRDDRAAQGLASQDRPAALFVHSSPPLFFHLAADLVARGIAVQPVGNLSVMQRPPQGVETYLATPAPWTRELPPAAQDPRWAAAHLRVIVERFVPWAAMSTLVRLDDPPRQQDPRWQPNSRVYDLEQILP